ncbi:MAG TPA: class I SAM-dependent methyltransferase [Solirubrobacteraceae bacterium]|jgi:2-polyprenyl-3-methyl-5-hydroxy-6-metoxy-1,4-benzoquinol methylase
MTLTLASRDGSLRYADTPDHLENGVLRLMGLRRDEFERWIELAGRSEEQGVLERLREGWAQLRPAPPQPHGREVEWGPQGMTGTIWHAAIAEAPSHGVAVCEATRHAWLVRHDGERFVRETAPPAYEEAYFEGDRRQAGGYGDYLAQAGWRLEKAARQVRELRARTALDAGRVLDIGSGYGFFRMALEQAGYEHDGLEVSEFARAVASSSYGQETYAGTLEEHWQRWEERYDAVTLFDLIEHIADPERMLEQIAFILKPRGVLVIKTPNIDCPEAAVFGPHYHSLKREHLNYFSAASLTAAARMSGFEAIEVASASHLLVGFVGEEQTRAWERELRGADLLASYRLAFNDVTAAS